MNDGRGQPRGICPCRWALVMALLGVTLVHGCRESRPLRLGFVGCLTGRLSDLGLSGRNGAMLAVEERNASGGVAGRPVELLIRDDQHQAEVALQVDQELIDAGVVAIIGHMTSAMTQAALPLVNTRRVVLLSPTASAAQFDGLDDYLIRLLEANSAESDHLADFAARKAGWRTLAAIVDNANAAYTHPFAERFGRSFEAAGGRMLGEVGFTSGAVRVYSALAQRALSQHPDALLLVAAALDGAMLCQQVRKLHPDIPILVAGWAHTPEFLNHGGGAVEGVIFSNIFDSASRLPRYRRFHELYQQRFARPPDFAACLGYEAAQTLLNALQRQPSGGEIRQLLVDQASQPGLQGDFSIDRFGDVRRQRHLITVKAGAYEALPPF
jgi:branched-chain amino acid transport system substrate-binding protein